VVVTRAIVEIDNVRLWGPLLMLGIELLLKAHVDPAGNPAPQDRVTDSEKPEPVGETVTEKFTCAPEGIVVAEEELALIE
jgi:hypothetical protein